MEPLMTLEQKLEELEERKKFYEHGDGRFIAIHTDEFSGLLAIINVQREALETAHGCACSCCNSSEEVKSHCQEALAFNPFEGEKKNHFSDCALHNGPYMKPENCSCGVDPEMTPEKYGSEFPEDDK